MIRKPLNLKRLSKRQLRCIIGDSYQAVACMAVYCDVMGHPDVVRLLDTLAYGRSVEDRHALLPWPREARGLPMTEMGTH